MSAAASPHQPPRKHANRWVLVDARMQLLAIGNDMFQGVSPRGTLDLTGRRVLAPRLRAAAVDGIERTTAASDGSMDWDVRVLPVLGPVLREPLAVLGCYGQHAANFPAPPLVGAWEWEVTPPGANQQMRTYWSDSLFDVYGIPRPEQHSEGAAWQGPEWLDEFPVEADRAELRALVDEALAATNDGLVLHSFNVRNPGTDENHRLRFAGRSYVSDPDPPWWFRGISMRIDHICPPVHSTPGPQEFLNAAFTLSVTPLCAIDTVYEHVYMTSGNFSDLRLWLPAHRHLPAMCHPDDLGHVRNYLAKAAANRTAATEPINARWLNSDNQWQTLTLAGAGVRLSDVDDPHHVLCSVTLAHD